MKNVFIGATVTIMYGVRIRKSIFIGANSIVNKDLEGGYVYTRSPARRICLMNI